MGHRNKKEACTNAPPSERDEFFQLLRRFGYFSAFLISLLYIAAGTQKSVASEKEKQEHLHSEAARDTNPCNMSDMECTMAWMKWKAQEAGVFDVKDQMPVEGKRPNDAISEKPKK